MEQNKKDNSGHAFKGTEPEAPTFGIRDKKGEWRAPYPCSYVPLWFVALFLLIPIWREVHFYLIHRLIHWRPLLKTIHYVHHLNPNPGPWSGLAMHPLEHLLYFSVVMIHFIVPSHPIHFFFNSQLTALTPATGHHGFEGPLFNGKLQTGSYFHYLHHRYVSCNFGESTVPLDRWFGRFYDGTGPYRTKPDAGA